jgi:hypothetical protein
MPAEAGTHDRLQQNGRGCSLRAVCKCECGALCLDPGLRRDDGELDHTRIPVLHCDRDDNIGPWLGGSVSTVVMPAEAGTHDRLQ